MSKRLDSSWSGCWGARLIFDLLALLTSLQEMPKTYSPLFPHFRSSPSSSPPPTTYAILLNKFPFVLRDSLCYLCFLVSVLDHILRACVSMHVKSPYDPYDVSYMLDCTDNWWLECHCLVYHHPCPSFSTCQYLRSPFVTAYALYYLLHCPILLHEFYQNLVSSLLVMREFMSVSQLHVKPNLSLLNPEEQQSIKTHTRSRESLSSKIIMFPAENTARTRASIMFPASNFNGHKISASPSAVPKSNNRLPFTPSEPCTVKLPLPRDESVVTARRLSCYQESTDLGKCNDLITMSTSVPPSHYHVFFLKPSIPRNILTEDQKPDISISFDATLEEDDYYILFPTNNERSNTFQYTFGAYKRVDKKIHPVSTSFPTDCYVRREIPQDPLLTLLPLPYNPPPFTPTKRITEERMKELKVNSIGFLSPEEETLFQWIMTTNEMGIAFEDAERGTLKESYFSPYIIPMVPHVPWEHKNIAIPPGLLERVLDVIKLKITAEVYEQSQSSYRSRWFVVLKKNGKLRIVHDLQPLNAISVRDAGMLPIVDDFVESFAGRQCYTVFDLFWGFDARKIHPKSRDLTAFMTPLGLLQITSLPTGYTNSPAEFQKCMVMILHDEIPNKANIFIDDLPIKGPQSQYLEPDGKPETLPQNPGIRRFIWEHAEDVHRIMHRVLCAGATFAANKAQICLPEVLIIGQKCNAQGRIPDTDKVSKILTWPTLTTPKEVRRFLGLCGTVRIWIPNYSKIVRPLTELYHIGKDFIWDQRRQEAFDYIKKLVASAPALHPINYTSDEPVVLSVDSSTDAAGMILSQLDNKGHRRPARYGSIPMSERESRYSQPKLELFGLYRALRHWRIYIIGVKQLHVEVDAQYIKGMLNEPDLQPSAAINRWIQGILMFDFKLIHVPAERHKGPDALSRRGLAENEIAEDDDDSWLDDIALLMLIPTHYFPPFPIHSSHTHQHYSYTISLQDNIAPSFQCLTARATQENMIQNIYRFLSTLQAPVIDNVQTKRRFLAKAMEFFIKDQRLYKRNGHRPPLLVIVEPGQKNSILLHAHENLGHKGVQAVYEVVRNRFFWPHLRADVHHHVKSCHECQIRSLKRVERPLTISAPSILFAKIYIDIMHMPPARGYRYIVAAKDDLSGTCEARPLRNATAKNLATFFWEQIYC